MNEEKELKLERISRFLQILDFKELRMLLFKNGVWTDGMNYIGFSWDNHIMSSVIVGLYDIKVHEVVGNYVIVDDFKKLLRDALEIKIQQDPDNEKELRDCHQDILRYLDKIRIKP